MKVVRKTATKELVATVEGSGRGVPVPKPDEEVVDFPDVTDAELNRRARSSAGHDRVGKIFVFDDGTVKAEAETPNSRTPITDRILTSRRTRGVASNLPVTLDELYEAERGLGG